MTDGRLVKCGECKKMFYFKAEHTHIQCEPFESDDGNEYAEIIETGCRCQHCKKWLHLGYLNSDLLKRQKELSNRRRRRAYERDYDKWQVECREALAFAEPERI